MRLQAFLQSSIVPFQLPSVLVIEILVLRLLLLDHIDLLSMRNELLTQWTKALHLFLEHSCQVLTALKR